MAKAKIHKQNSGISQKHLHSRISYLNQAATYLASSEEKSRLPTSVKDGGREVQFVHSKKSNRLAYTQTRNLLSQLRAVSLKSQIRLTPELKNSFCKRCDSSLIPAGTSDTGITNKSRLGDKPWADVLAVTCGFCGGVRRYPIGQKVGCKKVVPSIEAQSIEAQQGVDDSQHSLGIMRE